MYPDVYQNKEDNKAVYFFSSPFDPLNNWSAHAVKVWGKTFTTLEHAYHFKKFETTTPDAAKRVFESPSPWAAFKLSREYKNKVRSDWDSIKVAVMRELLVAKLTQNEDIKEILKRTGSREIVENSPWDSFWGCGPDGKGDNNLGKLWMELRETIR